MLSKCAALQPPDCTHLVFKDDFNAYQQQLHKKDNQKNPEELKKKKKREGLALLQARLCRLPANFEEGDLETMRCLETLRPFHYNCSRELQISSENLCPKFAPMYNEWQEARTN